MDEMRSCQMVSTETLDMPAHLDCDLESCADFVSVAEEDTACDSRDAFDEDEDEQDDMYDLQSLLCKGSETPSVVSEAPTANADVAPAPMPAMSLFLQNLVKSSSHHLASSRHLSLDEASGDDMSMASFGSLGEASSVSAAKYAASSAVPPRGPITLQVDNAIRQDDGKARLFVAKTTEREQRKQLQNVSRWEAIPAEPKKPMLPSQSSSLPLRRPQREESNRELVLQQRWTGHSSSSPSNNRSALGFPMRRPQREDSNRELVEQQLHRRWLSPTVNAPDTSRCGVPASAGPRGPVGSTTTTVDRPIKPPTRGNSDRNMADTTLRKPKRRVSTATEAAGKPDIPIRPPVRMNTSEQQIRQLAQIAAEVTAAIDSSDRTSNSDGTASSLRLSKLETSSPHKGGGGGEEMQGSITLLNAAMEAALQLSIGNNPYANGRPEDDQDDDDESINRRHSCPMPSPRVLSFLKKQNQLQQQQCLYLSTTPKQLQRAKSLPVLMSGVLRMAICENLDRFEHIMV